MDDVPIPALQEAIHNLHSCVSRWVEAVPVHETFQGKTMWDGTVQVFDIVGHPSGAGRCYAWSHYVDGSERRRFVAVLHEGRVDSPVAAVRAAIVAERKGV